MALYDARKAGGHMRRMKAAAYYVENGILDLLLEWASLGYPLEDQVLLLRERGLKTSRGTNFTQPGLTKIIQRAQELGQLPMSVEP